MRGFAGLQLVACLGVMMIAPAARGALTINLRFADGSTTKNLWGMQDGDLIDFYVYATITGQAGNSAPEGLESARYSLISQHIGNASWIDYGLVAPQLQTPFNNPPREGQLMDGNQDGSVDLGTGSTTNPNFTANPRAPEAVLGPGSGFGYPITSPSDGWEFFLQRVTFKVAFNNLNLTTQLRYNPILYREINFGPVWIEDGQYRYLGDGGNYVAGSSVTFCYLPEPTAFVWLCLAGRKLLERRSRAPRFGAFCRLAPPENREWRIHGMGTHVGGLP